MTINYDKVADAIYLNLKKGKIKNTVKMNDSIVVDFDAKKGVIGIEILNASANQQTVNTLENNIKNGIPVGISEMTPVSI